VTRDDVLMQAHVALIIGSAAGLLIGAVIGWLARRNYAVGGRAEAALLECQERLRILVDGVQDYAMIMLDRHGKVLSWNAGAERIKGYKADEIIGRSFSHFYPQEDIDQGRPEEDLQIAAKNGRAAMERWRVRKDGSRFWATLVMRAARDSSGTLLGFAAISRDVSERKEAEKRLVKLADRYRGLLDAAPDAMVISDSDGRILLVNAETEKTFGYLREDLIGQSVEVLVPERFRGSHPAHRKAYAAQPSRRSMGGGLELLGIRKDATEFPVEIMLSPLESPEGMLITATIRDISERKLFEEQLLRTVGELERSNDELKHFAYIASHDLQEPLRMVASYTQLLAKRYEGRLDSDADEFIAYAVDGSNRMQGMIQGLLAYSRAGANGATPCVVSSENALLEALENLAATLEESGAIVIHDSLPNIETDNTQLIQVFQNLIGNAIKYRGAEAPRVHVSATKNSANEWIFSVRDNGIGIDSEYFERIFILFQRLHTQKEFKGTGIGLAICRKVLERLGGRIWVESQVGRGSTFYFALPSKDERR
jgi:PAS domain S-box-containing protein